MKRSKIIGEATTSGSRETHRMVLPDEEGFRDCGETLRKGGLVAFPTETVYGLGANALDRDAVLSIFKTKGRPLTDPVIVHVAEPEDAENFVSFGTKAGRKMFERLTSVFWPGPLTIVAKARSCLPSEVSAGTGFVGVRCPAHPIARSLLRAARVPIAAPSANRFGHVSPTSSAHVVADLGAFPILVLKETASSASASEDDTKTNATSSAVCEVGIESTVAKIDEIKKEIVVFRRGGVPESEIRHKTSDLGFEIRVLSKTAKMDTKECQEAPGQMITHYAPDVSTAIVKLVDADADGVAANDEDLSACVVIDCKGQLSALKPRALAYRDLSPDGNMTVAANKLFAALRWAEGVDAAKRVLLADVSTIPGQHTDAVKDRMFRAASGVAIRIPKPRSE